MSARAQASRCGAVSPVSGRCVLPRGHTGPHRQPVDLLDSLLAGAAAHGKQSEPGHEVGDLQTLLEAAWARLTEEQRAAIAAEHDEIAEWGRL